jgi:hypothetical protein
MNKQDIINKAMQIEGMVSEWDLDLIYDQAQQYIKPRGCAIEIGGWKGRSTYVIGQVCKEKDAILYELDTFAGCEDPNSRKNQAGNLNGYFEAATNSNFIEIMRANLAGLPVVLMKGDSKVTIKTLPDKKFDYCFIDGNHESPMVDMDILNCIQKLHVGALMTGHDHGNPDGTVHLAVDKILGTDFHIDIRPLVGDPKYCLTIWSHVIKEEDYAKV